jgi:hypothetical protein
MSSLLRGVAAKLNLILIAVLITSVGACSLAKGRGSAEAAVVRFHDQFNAAQYHDIYSETDAEFKKVASENEFVTLLEAVHRKLGTVNGSQQSGWGVNTTPMGTVATLNYDVDFSEGKGSEQFVFHISGNKATLYRYNVNSPLLITK